MPVIKRLLPELLLSAGTNPCTCQGEKGNIDNLELQHRDEIEVKVVLFSLINTTS